MQLTNDMWRSLRVSEQSRVCVAVSACGGGVSRQEVSGVLGESEVLW